MNTNPDEAKLALWLDDELDGEELASFEAWALAQPEHVAAREETRRWRALMAAAVPASEEPPYPDFFNSRIAQAIREKAPAAAIPATRPSFWRSWLLPISACAGMVLTYWLGSKKHEEPQYIVEGAPKAIPVDQIVYTPESGVKADLFGNDEEAPTVIVLNGVRAIPDTLDFSQTAEFSNDSEFDSTADAESAETEVPIAP
jgi:hypothetical protein